MECTIWYFGPIQFKETVKGNKEKITSGHNQRNKVVTKTKKAYQNVCSQCNFENPHSLVGVLHQGGLANLQKVDQPKPTRIFLAGLVVSSRLETSWASRASAL